jgi:hypothetical protein
MHSTPMKANAVRALLKDPRYDPNLSNQKSDTDAWWWWMHRLNVKIVDAAGDGPLHVALNRGAAHVALGKKLAALGVDLEQPNKAGKTALAMQCVIPPPPYSVSFAHTAVRALPVQRALRIAAGLPVPARVRGQRALFDIDAEQADVAPSDDESEAPKSLALRTRRGRAAAAAATESAAKRVKSAVKAAAAAVVVDSGVLVIGMRGVWTDWLVR